jgi:hypothetical protein
MRDCENFFRRLPVPPIVPDVPRDSGSSNGGRVRRDRLLTYLVWTKYVTFQPFWRNDTVTDEITGMHEIAAQ